MAGYTRSFGAGNYDPWLLKLESNGNVIWEKTYGDIGSDSAYSVQKTQDGGFIVAGETASFGTGNTDYWVIKLDENGIITWQKTFGGAGYDSPRSIQQAQDGDISSQEAPTPSVRVLIMRGSSRSTVAAQSVFVPLRAYLPHR